MMILGRPGEMAAAGVIKAAVVKDVEQALGQVRNAISD